MSWLSSRQRSIFGMIACSSRIACSTRASVENPGLAAALARQPELVEQDRAELLGRADRELLARPARRSRARRSAISSCDARADPRQALLVEPDARDLHVAQHRDERQLDLVHQAGQPAVVELLALPGGQRLAERRVGGQRRRLAVGLQPALLADLGEREAAARGLQQVGGQQRVVGEVGRDRAPAPWRRGRSTGRSPSAATSSAGRRPSPTIASSPTTAPKRQLGSSASSWPSSTSGATERDRDLRARRRPARGPRRRRPRGRGRGRSPPRRAIADGTPASSSAASASSRRASGARSSNWRKTSRSLERSGSRAASAAGSTSTGTSRMIVASCLEIRASSAWLTRFSLRLAPEISSTEASTVSRSPNRCSSCGGGLVADARDAGDVVRRVALEAVEVGDLLGRDPVAVDDRLVVVELGVGDPAARRHHADARLRVDQLEDVAVAGDDDDRHVLRRAPLGDRGDDVVGLVAVDGDVAVAERLDQRREVRPLLAQQVRPRLARRLVVGRDLLAAGVARVPDDDRRLLAVLGQQLHEHRGEPEDRVGRHARRRRDRLRQGEERPVGERAAVDQVELVVLLTRSRPSDGP